MDTTVGNGESRITRADASGTGGIHGTQSGGLDISGLQLDLHG